MYKHEGRNSILCPSCGQLVYEDMVQVCMQNDSAEAAFMAQLDTLEGYGVDFDTAMTLVYG